MSWTPLLLPLPGFNAFVNGGTYLVVHYEVMNQVTDDELAAILGHEIGHVAANHVYEGMTYQAVAALTKSHSAKREGFRTAYTHENEKEADEIGILYAALAGFDPFAASRIWARMFKETGNDIENFVHDHPINSERETETRKIGAKVYTYYQAGKQNPDFERILVSNAL